MIVVIDYGMGNLRSVSKALESLGAAVRVSGDPADVASAEKLVLPGVGAFPAAMRELTARRLVDPIKAAIASGTPYLGICLGLQLLFERSEEGEGAEGLGVLAGTVKRFSFDAERSPSAAPLKVPHMGWNQVHSEGKPALSPSAVSSGTAYSAPSDRLTPPLPGGGIPFQVAGGQPSCPLLRGIAEGSFVYFVHSYYADPRDRSVVALESEYGVTFTAMVWRERLYATQFHPEKSQSVGLQLLRNFVAL